MRRGRSLDGKASKRFKDKLVKMIKDVDVRFHDYSTSPTIRQELLNWGNELVKHDLQWFISCSDKNELSLVK